MHESNGVGEHIGSRVKMLRVRADLSAREVSDKIGSNSLVTQLELGQNTNPTIETLHAIATVLGTSVAWLVYGTGRPPSAVKIRTAFESYRP